MTTNTRGIDEIRYSEILDAVGIEANVRTKLDDFGQPNWEVTSTDGAVTYIASFAPAYDVEGGDDERGDLGWDLNVIQRDNVREETYDVHQGHYFDVAELLEDVARWLAS